jgi:O-succinylbenzoate synthase
VTNANALDTLLAEGIPPIDHADLFLVRLPFVSPFAISTAVWTTKDALLLRLEAGGLTAWGECVADPDPFYAYETTTTARHVLKDFLLPLLEPGLSLGELERRMRHVRGHEMARATLENAVLDLIAKRKGIPLHTLLGAPGKRIPSGISIGIQESRGAPNAAGGVSVA